MSACLDDSCSGNPQDGVQGKVCGEACSPDASSAKNGAGKEWLPAREAVWSSGVAFYPPSRKYWRIGGKWYDFEPFLEKHPGGATVLLLARDRFEDCTFAFEAHHHNYRRARAVIRKYQVSEEAVAAEGLLQRPRGVAGHRDAALAAELDVKLLGHEAFYSVLRDRVATHLRAAGCPDGGPTLACKALFWASFVAWVACLAAAWYSGFQAIAVLLGFAASWLGAFGHNWVHQPRYRFWATLSLDTVGFSSEGWFREHILQHHMYTNTPWDNHFKGTDPFLVTDPTVERHWLQGRVLPYLNPLILCFALYGNYLAHLAEVVKGNEVLTMGKLLLPLQIGVFFLRWGWYGIWLVFISNSVLGIYYFSMALMNHNAEHCHDVSARNASKDWGEAQLNSSADWDCGCSFVSAGRYLWLNFHTVHHLFPRVDFAHHPAIQGIMVRTCDEFGIRYECSKASKIYSEMIHAFTTPLSLMKEVLVNAGGV